MNPRKKTLIAVLTEFHFVKDVAFIAASYLGFEGIKQSTTKRFGSHGRREPSFFHDQTGILYRLPMWWRESDSRGLDFRSGQFLPVPHARFDMGVVVVNAIPYMWNWSLDLSTQERFMFRTSLVPNVSDLPPVNLSEPQPCYVRGHIIGTVHNKTVSVCVDHPDGVVFVDRDTGMVMLTKNRYNGMMMPCKPMFMPNSAVSNLRIVYENCIISFHHQCVEVYDTDKEKSTIQSLSEIDCCKKGERVGTCFDKNAFDRHGFSCLDIAFLIDGIICVVSKPDRVNVVHFFVLRGVKIVYVGTTLLASNGEMTFQMGHQIMIEKTKIEIKGSIYAEFDVLM
jgi:hypothetical protein